MIKVKKINSADFWFAEKVHLKKGHEISFFWNHLKNKSMKNLK